MWIAKIFQCKWGTCREGDFMLDRKEIVHQVALEFLTDIIKEAMQQFKLSFAEVYQILEKLGSIELYQNNKEAFCVGAHDGTDPVLKKISEYLRKR